MQWGTMRICKSLLVIAGLWIFSLPVARANDTARLSGTYQVIHKSEVSGQARIQIQVHIVNPRSRSLHIQRMTLWDFSHPAKGGSQPCSLVVNSTSSADTTQEFTIPREEYDLWRRGARPRLVLEIATPTGHPTTEVVHLDRIGKVN